MCACVFCAPRLYGFTFTIKDGYTREDDDNLDGHD